MTSPRKTRSKHEGRGRLFEVRDPSGSVTRRAPEVAQFFEPATRPPGLISCNIFTRADELVREKDLSAGFIAPIIRRRNTVGL